MTGESANLHFDELGRFVIEDFNWAPELSGFLPGIAGKWGVPLWAYYVNRGQALCSLGSRDKDGAILEFLSFNRALQLVAQQGFRTFLSVDSGAVYEPFRKTRDPARDQILRIASHELNLEERHRDLKLHIHVRYFPLVGAPLGGLVRQVRIRNEDARARRVELVDGAPRLIPFGTTFEHLKVITRHIEAMMGVTFHAGFPFYRLRQTPADRAEVGDIRGANFYLSCGADGKPLREGYLIDPAALFGASNDFAHPWAFDQGGMAALSGASQQSQNCTPCGFTLRAIELSPGEETSLTTLIGHAPSERLFDRALEALQEPGFFEQKRAENERLIAEIKDHAFTASAEPGFDAYCGETFLENVMRGGMPTFFGPARGNQEPFYLFGRQNGDLERDYHWFVLEPSYLSQGTGHYRNVSQNRRMNTWFFPRLEDHDLRLFFNLIQIDGYNPLEVNAPRFSPRDPEEVEAYLGRSVDNPKLLESLRQAMATPFTPGELLLRWEELAPAGSSTYQAFLDGLLPLCEAGEVGGLHEGFWIDHWTYNLDLIDAFLNVYPERLRSCLWEAHSYTYFENPDVVLPRREKSILTSEGHVRQYGAVRRDPEKEALIASRESHAHKVREGHGRGEILRTNLFTKLLCLVATRLAALDPFGIGVEMEADKPGWNDSVNGLPGLFASSLPESLELLRATRLLLRSLDRMGLEAESLPLYAELADLMEGMQPLLTAPGDDPEATQRDWDRRHELLERYRARTRLGVSGERRSRSIDELRAFLRGVESRLVDTFEHAPRARLFSPGGVPYTYILNRVTEWSPVGERAPGSPEHVLPRRFTQRPAALFLEGAVHYIKVFPERAREIYAAVRGSSLYDRELKMFKVCESLADEPFELGRVKAYAPGWIENESIYTHMEYKWLLELLRAGLAEVFFEEARRTLMPFLPPAQYGRSTLENCSFIVSSAFPNPEDHGRAFQPRLSGVTAEMLEIWTLMVAGRRLFEVDEGGELTLALEPLLPAWAFTEVPVKRQLWEQGQGRREIALPAGSFAFRFLGHTLVTYHNPDRRDSFGEGAARPVQIQLKAASGEARTVHSGVLRGDLARAVREGAVRRLLVELR